MNTNQMWEIARRAANRIVAAEKRLWPNSEGVVCFTSGGGSTDTSFSRVGTSQQDITNIIPALLTSLLNANSENSAPDAGLQTNNRSFMSSMLTRDQNATPGRSTLDATMAIDPTTFGGSPTLQTIMGRNPYSTQFEADTEAAFRQRSADALAQVQTGHEAVRGGQSRSGIAQGVMATRLGQERGQEIRQAQAQDAGIINNATGLFNTTELGRRQTQLGAQNQLGQQSIGRTAAASDASRSVANQTGVHSQALDLAARYLGNRQNLNTDNLSGRGSQGTSSWGLNILGGCCFIFLQALNGKLPDYVERARHDFQTPVRRKGYKWMSAWLVPAMQRSHLASVLVNAFIIKPCLVWGRHHYGLIAPPGAGLLKPYVFCLFHMWHLLGLTVGRKVQ